MQATSAAVTLRGAEVLCREIRAPTLTNESESVLWCGSLSHHLLCAGAKLVRPGNLC